MRTRTSHVSLGLLASLCLLGAGCGGGETSSGPAAGTPEWYWAAAEENSEAGDFAKAAEHLEEIAKADGPLKTKAVIWRAVLLDGLTRGYTEVSEAYRKGINEKAAVADAYQNPLQQAHRDARQYAIELAEMIGDVDKALSGATVTLDFPFPSGGAGPAPVLSSVEGGDRVSEDQMIAATDHSRRRGVILAATEWAGLKAEANQASTKFAAGPVEVPTAEARLTVAKILLDHSVLFDRLRLNQPDVRKILIERAEQWSQPYVESEDEALKELATAFQDEIADERLDIDRKPRKLKKRGD